MKTLREIKIGGTARVVKVHGEGAVRRGVDIKITKVAPLGDPLEVTVRGYELSLRKEDAARIEVE